MLESLGPLLSLLGTILLIIIKQYQEGKPKREEKKEEENEQENRKSLEDGDSDSLKLRVDKLLPLSEGASSNSPKRKPSPEDDERRLREFLGISSDK